MLLCSATYSLKPLERFCASDWPGLPVISNTVVSLSPTWPTVHSAQPCPCWYWSERIVVIKSSFHFPSRYWVSISMTGIPAFLQASKAGATALASTGTITIKSHFCAIRSSTSPICFSMLESALVMINSYPFSSAYLVTSSTSATLHAPE